MVMTSLPWTAYSGMYSHTRSPTCSSPRCSSRWATTVVIFSASKVMTTVATHAQRDRGIEATAVEALHPRPDALDAGSRHPQRLDIGRLVRACADRVKVVGHPDAAQRVWHQWQTRDRRDRNALQRDHGRH